MCDRGDKKAEEENERRTLNAEGRGTPEVQQIN